MEVLVPLNHPLLLQHAPPDPRIRLTHPAQLERPRHHHPPPPKVSEGVRVDVVAVTVAKLLEEPAVSVR